MHTVSKDHLTVSILPPNLQPERPARSVFEETRGWMTSHND